MKKFTLASAVEVLFRHLLITIFIVFAAYSIVPNLNIFEDKYEVRKILQTGDTPKGFSAPILRFQKIFEIISSRNMSLYLQENLSDVGIASYLLTTNDLNNVFLTFKGANQDAIVATQTAIMKKLQEYDQKQINKQLDKMKLSLEDLNQEYAIILSSKDNYALSKESIKNYSALQDSFVESFPNYDYDGMNNSSNNIVSFIQSNNADVSRNVDIDIRLLNQKRVIEELELKISEGFSTVSYLYPVSKGELVKYYPNNIIFFGISLFIAFLYNLIVLNYKFSNREK